MAKKGGRRGGSSAARSAAAKKGWETRRRGGANAKPTAPSRTTATPKTTTARGRARTAETKARAAVRAGGGTRATRSLLTAQRARDYYKATGTGTKRSRSRSYGPANGIRATGRLPRPVAGNGIRRTTGPRRAPMAAKQNAIRTYTPATPLGLMDKGLRGMSKGIRSVQSELPKIRQARSQLEGMKRRMARQAARDIANRSRKGIAGDVARISLAVQGSRLNRAGADVIRRRAARATAAAARGSVPAARAREIYGTQLAGTGAGKPSRTAKSGIRPGPRNTKGTPKKRKRKG
jgi:hypothetical protein